MVPVKVSLLLTALLLIGASVAVAVDEDEASMAPDASPCPTVQPLVLASAEPSEIMTPAPSPDPADPCAAPSGDLSAFEVTIEAGDLWFDPGEVVIPANGTTTITLRDRGVIAHNITVDDLGLLVVAPAGRSATATIVDPAPGTYEFYCSISGHRQAGMVGTLIVE